MDTEEDEKIEGIETREQSVSVAPSRDEKISSIESGQRVEATEQRVIRFEDGDPENPNNCKLET